MLTVAMLTCRWKVKDSLQPWNWQQITFSQPFLPTYNLQMLKYVKKTRVIFQSWSNGVDQQADIAILIKHKKEMERRVMKIKQKWLLTTTDQKQNLTRKQSRLQAVWRECPRLRSASSSWGPAPLSSFGCCHWLLPCPQSRSAWWGLWSCRMVVL